MKNTGEKKQEVITPNTLVCGIDIAKNVHWARFIDYRGIELSKAVRFENNKSGFETIVTKIEQVCKEKGKDNVVVGMEPTGPYWKALAWHLKKKMIQEVVVNPYHTKRSKELDDNSPTKNDPKDALVIAKLVKDWRFSVAYLPEGVYAELRELTNNRTSIKKMMNSVKNQIAGILDQYFPEYTTVFKKPLRSKTSLQILKSCPFPMLIQELGIDGVLAEIKKGVNRTVGRKRAEQLLHAAEVSVGIANGLESVQLSLRMKIEQFELLAKQLELVEKHMEQAILRTGYAEILLDIKGMGVVSLASLLGEIGDPMRFESPRQINRLAGYNLVEDSSGKSKSGTVISKRGRGGLRAVLYFMAVVMVKNNNEMKQFYRYLKTRSKNPLKSNQALVVVAEKILTIIHALVRKHEIYQPEKVFGSIRKEQMKRAA
jgi:transposase